MHHALQNGILDKYGVELIGAKLPSINRAEDRQIFRDAMTEIGLKTPLSGTATSMDEAMKVKPGMLSKLRWSLLSGLLGVKIDRVFISASAQPGHCFVLQSMSPYMETLSTPSASRVRFADGFLPGSLLRALHASGHKRSSCKHSPSGQLSHTSRHHAYLYPVAWAQAVLTQVLDIIGNFPVIIRPAFTLGGTGGGIAYNMEEFKDIMEQGLAASVTKQVTLPICKTRQRRFKLKAEQ